jgi:hypothetical protein
MAVAEKERQQEEHSGGGAGKTALTTAAVAAATGAAAYGLQKAFSHGGGGGSRDRGRDGDSDGSSSSSKPMSIVGSAASSAWESASHTIVPIAEEAADAAGKWVAEHAPDVVRERIMPRFIESYNDAS